LARLDGEAVAIAIALQHLAIDYHRKRLELLGLGALGVGFGLVQFGQFADKEPQPVRNATGSNDPQVTLARLGIRGDFHSNLDGGRIDYLHDLAADSRAAHPHTTGPLQFLARNGNFHGFAPLPARRKQPIGQGLGGLGAGCRT